MNLKHILQNRFSVRSFQSKEVEKEKLEYLLECARLAPSACNLQPWSFIIACSDEARTKVQKAYNREWFRSAPCYIIACGNHSEAWRRASDGKDATDIDVSIAAEHICIATEEIGLGTCWVCNFNLQLLKEEFNLPEHIEPIALFPIGYPVEGLAQPEQKRKDLNQIVKWL